MPRIKAGVRDRAVMDSACLGYMSLHHPADIRLCSRCPGFRSKIRCQWQPGPPAILSRLRTCPPVGILPGPGIRFELGGSVPSRHPRTQVFKIDSTPAPERCTSNSPHLYFIHSPPRRHQPVGHYEPERISCDECFGRRQGPFFGRLQRSTCNQQDGVLRGSGRLLHRH